MNLKKKLGGQKHHNVRTIPVWRGDTWSHHTRSSSGDKDPMWLRSQPDTSWPKLFLVGVWVGPASHPRTGGQLPLCCQHPELRGYHSNPPTRAWIYQMIRVIQHYVDFPLLRLGFHIQQPSSETLMETYKHIWVTSVTSDMDASGPQPRWQNIYTNVVMALQINLIWCSSQHLQFIAPNIS